MQTSPEEPWAAQPQGTPDAPPAPPPAPAPELPPVRPWGFWATMGWSALTALLDVLLQSAVLLAFIVVARVSGSRLGLDEHARALETNGLVLAVVSIIVDSCGVGFLALAPIIRGCPMRVWFGLKALRWRETAVCLAILAVFIVAGDLATYAIGKPVVPEFMVSTWKTAGFLPLLLVALVVAAPVFEEIGFRGFLFQGIAKLPHGGIPAVLVTAALWALIHQQYDWFGILMVFLSGLLLGTVRLVTGSTTLTIVMHAAMNAVASAEAFFVVDVMK
jgi:membrane protease YdiL (CAAX protease family)